MVAFYLPGAKGKQTQHFIDSNLNRIFQLMKHSFLHSSQLDIDSKKWRIRADILNDIAMATEIMLLPHLQDYTTFILCATTTMKAIVGVAGGATRSALTQHHAIRGNLADVASKDSSQETCVNLIASFFGLWLLTAITQES